MAEPGDTAKNQLKNPRNFVTLVQLKERWLKKKAEEEEERIRKQQQEEREKEERQRKLVEAKEENERRQKLEEAKERSSSKAVRRNFGTSSHRRQNRSRMTPANVVATVGFAEVVDEGGEAEERRWRVEETKEPAKSEAVRNSGTSSHWRQNRIRWPSSNAATVASAQAVDEGNEDDEAIKLKVERYRRKKERKAAKRAMEKEKVKEEGRQPVVSETMNKESMSTEVMMDSQRKHNNVEKQISERGAEIGNQSVPARKSQRKSKGKTGNVEKNGTKLDAEEKLSDLSIEEENGGGFETRNSASDIVEKDTSKARAETVNGSVPRRKPWRKYKVNMEFGGKIGNVKKEGSKVKIKEKLSEISVEEENGGFETKYGVNDNVERQIKGAEIGNGSVPSWKPQRNSTANMEFGRKLGKIVEKEGSKIEFEGNLGKLSIEEENGGFKTKTDITDGDRRVPSRKPQIKSKVNMEFRRKIDKKVEHEESKLEMEEILGELSIEEEKGVSEGKYGRGRGRLNHSERQNNECKQKSYWRFHGSRGRGNVGGGRVHQDARKGGYNGECKLGVWVRKGDVAGSGVQGTVKSSDVRLMDTSI